MALLCTVTCSPIGIIAAVLAHMILGMLWYSPQLCGRFADCDTPKKANKPEPSMHAGHVIAELCNGLTLAICFSHFNSVAHIMTCTASIQQALFAWGAFVATTSFSQVIWEGRPMATYLVTVGFWLVDFALISCIVTRLA